LNLRVLLVEDDAGITKSVELMLKSEGMYVDKTVLGEEGVDLGKIYDYDVILLDLALPDISGYDVLRSLRSARVATPILILSGLASIEDKIKGLGLGADDYLSKPFHKDELAARIRALVRRSKGHAESVIAVGDLIVNLESRTVEINGLKLYLTGKEYQILALLALRHGSTLTKETFLNPPLWRLGGAGGQDHRRLHLQTQKEARQRQRRPGLHRNGLGTRVRPTRTNQAHDRKLMRRDGPRLAFQTRCESGRRRHAAE
jgi:two-component system, cell cycle response regulator CtrA